MLRWADICTDESDPRTVESCLDVGACLKVNTRALGRGALHKKGDSIPLQLTSEKEGRTDNSHLAFPPRFPSYHLVKHAFCILYKPQTPVNHYLYRLPQTAPRYDIMITNTCCSGNVRKNKTKSKLIILFYFPFKSNINLPNFPIHVRKYQQYAYFKSKTIRPSRKYPIRNSEFFSIHQM